MLDLIVNPNNLISFTILGVKGGIRDKGQGSGVKSQGSWIRATCLLEIWNKNNRFTFIF